MTNNRFYVDKSPVTHLFVPYDNEKEFVFEGVEKGNTIMKLVGLLNNALKENEQLKSENETYKNMFFEIVETALTDKNCRELYCKGILDIFDKANSLNQAREMIKEHLK